MIAWVRISSIRVGLPYFNFCVANRLSLQIEHLPYNIEDEARCASRSARHLCQSGILTKRFQRIKRASIWSGVSRPAVCAIANLVEAALAAPSTVNILKISRRLRSLIE